METTIVAMTAGADGRLRPTDRTIEELLGGEGWFWIDVLAPSNDTIDEFARIFDLNELDVDDIRELSEFPKLEERVGYTFLIAHTPSTDETRFRTVEVDFVLGERFLVTIRRHESPGIEVLRSLVSATELTGPDDLMARAMELVTRRTLPLLGPLDELIYVLEDQALDGDPTVPHSVQAMRRDVIRLRRVIGPQSDALLVLGRGTQQVTSKQARNRFFSAHEDCVRIADSLDAARSLLGSTLDTYRATVAERMNEVMKVLTVFSAIALPLGLIAGIYGTNFADIPGISRQWGFAAMIAVMALVGGGLWAYFIARRFIGGPRIPRVDRVVHRGLAGFVHLTLTPVRLLDQGLRATMESLQTSDPVDKE